MQGIELRVKDTVGEDVAHATSLPTVLAVCRHTDVPLRERASQTTRVYQKDVARTSQAYRRENAR
jgi:hypothetical protein